MDRPLLSSRIDAATPGLAARLRAGTHDLHRASERSGAMVALRCGKLDRSSYAVLLVNLQAIYGALEAGLERHADLFDLPLPLLYRGASLAQDVAALGATPGTALTQATACYVQRLQCIGASAAQEAWLLLAHAYVRYLGDLHGGQLLKRCIQQSLDLDGQTGTHFYDFGPPTQVAQLIQEVRAGIDAAPFDAGEIDALVAEARLSFQLHLELFEQLPH